MATKIKLPLLTGFKIEHFSPIYSNSIELELRDGSYVVIGGNGLGKTTLMQAVVYGLAGELGAKIEDDKKLRWKHSYFAGRLDPKGIENGLIEVQFRLGENSISVRRGTKTSSVLAIKKNRSKWITKNANQEFAEALLEYGGYLDVNDFAFIVHRLLYLPETRRLIAWDTDAQLRLLMLLNQDIVSEQAFRERRKTLKLIDSKKRHIHVALEKAKKDISNLYEFDIAPNMEEDALPIKHKQPLEENSLPELVARLKAVAARRALAERLEKEQRSLLSQVSAKLEDLREQMEQSEASSVANLIAETEKEQNLALSKLLKNTICPACGQKHVEFARRAHKLLTEHRCVLCGSDEPDALDLDPDLLCSEITNILTEQQALEEIIRLAETEADILRDQEFDLQARVNEIRYDRSAISMVSVTKNDLPESSLVQLEKLKHKLAEEEADAEAQIHEIRKSLEIDYSNFQELANDRIERLRLSYEKFATEFLGLECKLDEIEKEGLLDLKLFVPKFDQTIREAPESCSEAQRFFLDIAFRMALIDLASGEDRGGTFICETPETALDFSYVKNVVKMFLSFTEERHNILLSANIQQSGIADKIISKIPLSDRKRHVVNLLDFGRLSAVQLASRREFDDSITRMLLAEPEGN